MTNITRLKNIVLLLIAVLGFSFSSAQAQEKIDRTVATIKLKDRGITDSIKYSDVMFQLALTPNFPLDPPNSKDFDRALQFVIQQRLLGLSGIGARPTEAEIRDHLGMILARFSSSEFLNTRLRILGFKSMQDLDVMRRIEQSAWIEKYLNSRFRSGVAITSKEEEDYYQNVFLPAFQRSSPGVPAPDLDKQRLQIRATLIETRAAKSIEDFLKEVKQNAEIIISEPGKAEGSNNKSLN